MHLAGYAIEVFEPSDAAEVQALFESDSAYFEIIQGAPPGPAETESLISGLPPGKSHDDKFVYVVRSGEGELCAVIDLVRDYPERGIWYLGLVFVAPARRNTGLGTRLLNAICAHAKVHGGEALRLAVVRGNARARALYDRAGFAFVIARERELREDFRVMVDVLERPL